MFDAPDFSPDRWRRRAIFRHFLNESLRAAVVTIATLAFVVGAALVLEALR